MTIPPSKFSKDHPFNPAQQGPLHTFTETAQEGYEKIRAYFTAPGAFIAKNGKEGCAYRVDTPKGVRACAVGCLIPDEHYDVAVLDHGEFVEREEEIGMVQYTIDTDFDTLAAHGVLKVEDPLMAELLDVVQGRHDTSLNAELFVEKLDTLAANLGLKVLA